jgi:K+-transporting ATPase ATPase C chain
MLRFLLSSILLLVLTIIICCGLYPLTVWAIGKAFFPFQADGSLLKGPDGSIVGSKLIAQPFTKDEYFQPRPSAASYDASASASSTYAASNYLLRNRVATVLGPIVKYKSGPKADQLVAPDIESWFQQDKFLGNPHLVAQWADMHNAVAQAWVNADPTHGQYVDAWSKAHPDSVAKWIKDNPSTPQPKAPDLAIVFFENFSADHPGMFPSPVTQTGTDGKPQTSIQPVKVGSDIQANFFDMWRQEHADADLQDVLVTASGSGLDPHITLANAEFQLDRVAAKWADDTQHDAGEIRKQIEQILQNNVSAPFGGLAGEKLVNVLEVNLELCNHYGLPK